MTTLPTTAVVLLSLAGPFVAVVAVIVSWLRERSRQKHERDLQRAELEDRRLSRLREDRLKAYSTLARLTKVVEAEEEYPHKAIAEAHSEIELLTDNRPLQEAAWKVFQASADAWQVGRTAFDKGIKHPYPWSYRVGAVGSIDRASWAQTKPS